MDDTQAKKVGDWKESKFSGGYIGDGYIHDIDAGKGEKTLLSCPTFPKRAATRSGWRTPGDNHSAAVPVIVFSHKGEKPFSVDMRAAPPIDGRFFPLSRYAFEKTGRDTSWSPTRAPPERDRRCCRLPEGRRGSNVGSCTEGIGCGGQSRQGRARRAACSGKRVEAAPGRGPSTRTRHVG